MITFALLVALIGQTPVQENQAPPPAAAAPTIVLTSRASNGDLRGSTTTVANGVWYAYSAPNACTTVISQTMPASASVAWQLEIAAPSAASRYLRFKPGAGDLAAPIQFYREGLKDKLGVVAMRNVVTIQVTSQRRWEDGVRKDGPARTTQLSLRPGTSVMLDYVSTSPTDACNAVGVSLEIASPPARATTTIETDLWLVHRLPDGSEQTQRQTLRSRLAGTGTDYYFDDIKVATPRGDVTVEILGRVVPYAKVAGAEGEKLRVTVDIQRRYATTSPAIGWKTRSGSSTNNIEATPGEVLSFNLPPLDDDGVLVGHRFSLRLQPTQVRPGA